MTSTDLATELAAHCDHLRRLAYRLLGSLDDADDALQQVWFRASAADPEVIENPVGWLTTTTARICLDMLRARGRRQRLSETIEVTSLATVPLPDDEAQHAEDVGLAMLVVLDRLSPAQRVAFVLHDLFSFPFEDIAAVLDRSPDAAKKLASRARGRVRGHPPAARQCDPTARRLADAFLTASREGDLEALLALLAPDVVRTADHVAALTGTRRRVLGARAAAEESIRHAPRRPIAGLAVVDGEPGIVVAPLGHLVAVVRLRYGGDLITAVDVIASRPTLDGTTVHVL